MTWSFFLTKRRWFSALSFMDVSSADMAGYQCVLNWLSCIAMVLLISNLERYILHVVLLLSMAG